MQTVDKQHLFMTRTSTLRRLVVLCVGILVVILCRAAHSSNSDRDACAVVGTCGNGIIDDDNDDDDAAASSGISVSATLDRIRERRRSREEAKGNAVPGEGGKPMRGGAGGGGEGGEDSSDHNDDGYANRIVGEAMGYHAEGRHEEALSLFARLRESRRDEVSISMAEAAMYHGIVLAREHRGEEALECWNDAISMHHRATSSSTRHRRPPAPDANAQSFINQVGMLMYAAAEHYSDVAKTDPKYASDGKLHFDAARLWNAIGETERATTHLQTVLRLRPDDFLAMFVLGTLLERAGNVKEAAILKRNAIELQPGNVGGAMISAARSCEENDLEACYRRYLLAYEYAYEGGDVPLASRAVSSAVFALLQYKGDAGLEESRKIGELAVSRGVLNAPMQMPGNLVLGLYPAKAYHDDIEGWEVVRVLEGHAEEIRNEILAAYKDGKLHNRYEYDSVGNLATRGHWAEVNIIRQGMPQSRIVELLPITSSAVLSIMDASTMIHGGSKVSIIDGGSLVRPHTGATNSRLRVHMGLMVPPDCGIVVNGEERTWAEGKCMVFDDSFVHSVWQNSSLVRIILIVDIWHPRLNETGRLATMNEEQRKWYHGIKSMMADGVWMEAAGKIQQMIKT
jgi:tetratricopeptide (TPR) repeat protein